jgi:Fe2+ or Zn2+ uptake regulation protein
MEKEICSSNFENWLILLQEGEKRLTQPRRTVTRLLFDSQRALSALDVFDLGRKVYPRLGLVTVYRTLDKLEELGLIQRVHMPDGCHRYIRAMSGHQHLLFCTTCGQAVFFEGDNLSILMDRVVAKSGYRITAHWLQFFGTCPECQATH